MLISDIKRVIDQVSRDKGIEPQVLYRALEEALKSAAKKKYGGNVDIEAHYNEEIGEIEVFIFKEVAAEIEEPDLQISLEEGRLLDPECEVGDEIGTKMDATTFGRIAAQSAKQVIIQKLKDAERAAVYSGFINRKGEIINGIVQRIDRSNIIVNLGTAEAVLPYREQIPRETYRRGDRVRATIMKVLEESRGPQIVLSRTHPSFLISLFKTEVPEISEGIVNIVGAAREAGSRAKIAVSSQDSDIDPVGACVGMKGSRVQNVVQELRGEKIDIIPWHVDQAKFVCNALSPAEISRVVIDEEDRSMEVIVPDEFLSVAIGKRGQNVRLASKLTGWDLDVQSESIYSQTMKAGYDSLMEVPGVSIGLADVLYEAGICSSEDISLSAVEDLVQVEGIDEEKALSLIEAAKITVVEVAERAAAAAEEAVEAAEAAEAAAEEAAEAAAEEAAAEEGAEVEAPLESDGVQPPDDGAGQENGSTEADGEAVQTPDEETAQENGSVEADEKTGQSEQTDEIKPENEGTI